MNEKVIIFIIQNGFRYSGDVIVEDELNIAILDDNTKNRFDFPKNQIVIQREGKKDGIF